MAEILLFHSILGPRPGVADAANRLRAAGHTVHTPDFFGGKTFDDYPPAFEFVDSIGGIPELINRTKQAVEGLAGWGAGPGAFRYRGPVPRAVRTRAVRAGGPRVGRAL
jgi:dienelactone hydrolase